MVEQYIPASVKCIKCQRYGHHRESCRGPQTCGMCCEKDPSYMEEDCSNEAKYPNCWQNHPAFSKSCGTYKREKKIMEIKYKKNVSFLEARKNHCHTNSDHQTLWLGPSQQKRYKR